MGKVRGLIFIQIDHPKWEAQRYNRYDTVLGPVGGASVAPHVWGMDSGLDIAYDS